MRLRAALVLALIAALLTAPPALAEVVHPRQQWLRDATAGLFLHWGMFTAPRHLDCAAWERDVTGGGWSAGYWVDEARKLGASYIVLATFHSRLGYARPWPSAIPGSCATERDLLGELVAAGKEKGVRVLLYMTDDPQWHAEQGVETLDSVAYSAYKGQRVDLTTRAGFGMFSYDLFFEVMERYPDLAGFWIDNDNEYWEQHRLYEQIRERRPSWLLSNNNEDTPIMDTVSNEQKTGMTPPYDYPQAAWTPMPRLTEADYKLPTTGDWWYDGGDHPVDVRLSTGRFITNAGSSMKSLMAETPMVNGRFPPQQEAFNAFMSTWVPPISESLRATEGGGYMYGGLQPGFWNDGAHGVITVRRDDPDIQYVHVVTRPSTDHVRLRDNGYRVRRVSDLRTGRPLRFAQSGGHLTILGITAWDDYDTVFKVETAGRTGFLDGVTSTAPELVDGSFETFWDAGGRLPASVTLDLGRRERIAYLAVNQREWSPVYARESFGRPEDSARIKNYRVHVSDDGRHWGRPVRAAALPSARGVQIIDLGERHARYVKLEVLDTWAGPQAPRFHRQLRIDEIAVARAYPLSRGSLPLEAEHQRRSGGARVERCAACSGSAQVTGLSGGTLTYRDVTAPAAGEYRLRIDHTAAAPAPLSISVNGAAPTEVRVPGDNPDVPAATSLPVTLKAGANTIALTGAAGVDRIAIAPMPAAPGPPRTTMTVDPSGLQWVGPGRQTLNVSATLRLDDDEALDQVSLAPAAPAGWTVEGGPATAATLRLGQTLTGSWTITSPGEVSAADVPISASFRLLGRPGTVTRQLRVRPRPADRVFMREAEDSRNRIGDAGITSCAACSGGQKVRNLGGGPDAYVLFEDVTVPAAGSYTLFVDFTVNGERSYVVTVNDGTPVEVKVSGTGNNTPYTTTIPVTLRAGANTVKLHNDAAAAPDLDRISLG
ncbi:Alpha-L-fucosidase [[Actinomadura] parvosata subsp. kistnae]|uniref:alpha-L-fucosidase n=1 Tax=[Actinomadura] parvosata subsp. kistnae TaxID=1909395 RepID=A0A1U9ZZV0_9ACTN|nr:CBM35 domain-containing protein [Nonomuraea sp. ATCC 55076]AQZ63475.1 alpha-L-fucosidase [Nonomuraea sp. ATCC 55076]SPL99211.1 Alpha-L-fucosidase [Actinomadura parvosata subsp. kistnae]